MMLATAALAACAHVEVVLPLHPTWDEALGRHVCDLLREEVEAGVTDTVDDEPVIAHAANRPDDGFKALTDEQIATMARQNSQSKSPARQ
jgi:hypothetical protein